MELVSLGQSQFPAVCVDVLAKPAQLATLTGLHAIIEELNSSISLVRKCCADWTRDMPARIREADIPKKRPAVRVSDGT